MVDIFAVNPTFYLLGKDKTVSWIGCVSSAVLIGFVLAVIIFFTISYSKKSDFEI